MSFNEFGNAEGMPGNPKSRGAETLEESQNGTNKNSMQTFELRRTKVWGVQNFVDSTHVCDDTHKSESVTSFSGMKTHDKCHATQAQIAQWK